MTESKLRIAPDGQIWLCPACGRKNKDRYNMGDTSCVTWASLVWEGTLRPVHTETLS